MDVRIKFLLEIGHLSHHTYSEELLDNDIGTSVIVGRVLSVSNKELNSGPLKCVSIREEPPLHLQDKPKNVINLFLWNKFAKLDIDVGVLVVVNPGTLTKVRNQLLQAAVGFNGIGKMWIHGSARSAEDPSASGQQDVPGRGCCKGERFCGMASWCPTPFLNVKSRTMTLLEASSHSTSSFNLTWRSGEPADARKILKRGNCGRHCVDSPNSSSSYNDRFLEDSLPPLTSVGQLTEITQTQKQCSARPAMPPEAEGEEEEPVAWPPSTGIFLRCIEVRTFKCTIRNDLRL